MRTSAIACAILAGTFGFGSVASAQGWDGDRRGDRGQRSEQRQDRQDDRRADRREARREARADRREERRDDRQQDRAWRQGYRAGAHQPDRHVWQPPRYQAPQANYQRHYGWRDGSPAYRHGPRFARGTYLPNQYRQRHYYVNDWHSHRGLYAPPYGHQWVNVDGEFLLVALATGLIASAILN